MSWTNKAKTSQGEADQDILTPNLLQILVGSAEDLVLIWQSGFTNWGLKAKNAVGSWSLKSKTIS